MLGDDLLSLCAGARTSLLLAAPFVKHDVMQRLLDHVDDSVSITCVTRWHPQEIAAGVSDLEVWSLFRNQPRREMFLHQALHAKYYRADDRCLVGSANLTAKALGYATFPNLELLVPFDAGDPTVSAFESALMAGSETVDDEVAALTRAAVEELPAVVIPDADAAPAEPIVEPAGSPTPSYWFPRTRQPEDLYVAYAGDPRELPAAARAAAIDDLSYLGVPPGLGERQFTRMVGLLVLRLPLFRRLDDFVAQERRFGEVTEYLAPLVYGGEPIARVWQTVFRWLMFFAPDRYHYRRPRHSELIVRATTEHETQ